MVAVTVADSGVLPGASAVSSTYGVVHLVAQEAATDLIGPQVLDHMAAQAATPGVDRPVAVVVGLLEPARSAMRPRMRARTRELAERAPGVEVVLLPYVSRLGVGANARHIARRLRRRMAGAAVVYHCRGESAAEWALAVSRYLPGAIVADIRGAWPEELLFARGFDGLAQADAAARRDHEVAMRLLRRTLARAGAVVSVSEGMLAWLRELGVEAQRLAYVPCCVAGLTFDPTARERVRRELALSDKTVWCYMGTVTRYQHVADGVLPFFAAAARQAPAAHLLALTPHADEFRALLHGAGIGPDRATVARIPQRDVAQYLSAADAGLLLRAPSRMNRFSQPTKLGEYLAAGLPVIVSRGTGRVDRLVEQEGIGAAVDCFGVDPATRAREAGRALGLIHRGGASMRQRALAVCEREFLWSVYVPTVREVYRRALERSATRVGHG